MPPRRQCLWLAPGRNYHCVKEENPWSEMRVVAMRELAPGIWFPSDYQYEFSGRKFLFSFEENQTIEASHYRRVGPPSQAIEIVRNDLNTLVSATPAGAATNVK